MPRNIPARATGGIAFHNANPVAAASGNPYKWASLAKACSAKTAPVAGLMEAVPAAWVGSREADTADSSINGGLHARPTRQTSTPPPSTTMV